MHKLISIAGFTFLATCSLLANASDLQFSKNAQDAGIKSCLSTIKDMEKFFGEGNNYGSWAFWSKNNSDKKMFNTSVELTFNDGAQLIDLVVAPTTDGNCSWSYTRTWHMNKTCMAVSKEKFMSDMEYKTELNQKIAVFQKGGVKVLLMPAGDGCIVQKKESDFEYKKQGA